MRHRLPGVLSASDLPLAELCAARLDGELVPLDECFCPVDAVLGASERAEALARTVPARLIAERESAAWVWGALEHPPTIHRLCVDAAARVHPPPRSRLAVREVLLDVHDTVTFRGFEVTTPLRTATDIVRFEARFGVREARTVSALLRMTGAAADDCARAIAARSHLPHKRRALGRLRRLGT
jgi:hypothetical protein